LVVIAVIRRGGSVGELCRHPIVVAVPDGWKSLGDAHVTVQLEVRGQGSVTELAAYLHELDGMIDVRAGDGADLVY
jgi:hypothetical protein